MGIPKSMRFVKEILDIILISLGIVYIKLYTIYIYYIYISYLSLYYIYIYHISLSIIYIYQSLSLSLSDNYVDSGEK